MTRIPEKTPDNQRNHAAEKHLALSRRAARLAEIREKRDDGSLAQEMFQVSQALILCGPAVPADRDAALYPEGAACRWQLRCGDLQHGA